MHLFSVGGASESAGSGAKGSPDQAPVQGEGGQGAGQVVGVTTEQEWDRLVHTAGLVLVDVYNEWCGPCASMDTHLKKLRLASLVAEDRVTLARACCDHISELAPFRRDPRPTWLFLSSGIPTALLRGVNRPLLTKLFHNELALEREGRMPVYIDYKSQR